MLTREHMIHARPYQQECVDTLWAYFQNGGTGNPIAALPTGCHAIGHPILMFDGSVKPVEAVLVDDLLMGPDSKPRTVLSLARGRDRMCRILPTKGLPFVVNQNHILSLLRNDGKKKTIENLTVSDWQSKSKTFKHCSKLRRSPVEFAVVNELEVHPYLVGLLLGDGSTLNGGVNVTTPDPEIVKIVQYFAGEYGLKITEQNKKDNKASTYCMVFSKGKKNPLTEALTAIDAYGYTCGSKFVPFYYKTASRTDRLWIIAGLLDTDGHRTGSCFDFISKSKQLSQDLQFLCRSVGLAAYVVECQKGCQTGAVGTYWRCCVSGDTDIIPNQVARKKCQPRKQKKDVLVTGFKVEELPEDDYYGFALDGDHLYLDGEFIVHHNTGKSILPPLFIERAFSQYPNQRMIMLTHVKELVEQNAKALKRVWPTAPLGVYSAGLDKKEAFAPIVFGSIQSVKNNIANIGYRDMLWIDEAHLLSPNESSMYQQVIDELRRYNPSMPVVGLSATPFRMGQGKLTDSTFDKDGNAKPAIFTEIVFDITGVAAFNRLIDECYLSPLIPKQTDHIIDVSDVRELAGEFVQSDLAASIKKQDITRKALAEAWQIASDRKSWIVFGAGIENCEAIKDILNEMGIGACCVHSKMKSEDRDKYINAFKAGHFRAIVSNNILTTGFDHPQVDCIIDLRPTTSVVLHVQKYGRGTRPYFHPTFNFDQLRHFENRKLAIEMGGKKNCIVLDFAGNTMRLGPINDPVIPNKKKKAGTGEAPVKLCEKCGGYNHTTARFCADCGHEFVFKTKIKSEASMAEIIRKDDYKDAELEVVDVSMMNGYLHKKNGKTDKVRVQYFSGMQSYNVWLGFEPNEKGFVKHRAHEWWRQHSPGDIPQSTAEALDRFDECRKTAKLKVDVSGQYPEVMEFLF